MPAANDSLSAISQLQSAAGQSRHRALLVLSGERQWACELLLASGLSEGALWVSDNAPDNATCIEATKARHYLGRDIDGLVYDAWSGFDPDALAAVSGALVGGGILVILVPDFSEWPHYADPDYQRLLVHPVQIEAITGRFIQHMITAIESDNHALTIKQHQSIKFTPADSISSVFPEPMDDHCLTQDQSLAVKAIITVAKGRSRRPLVIRSDRGRGKSSALGIASASLMQHGEYRIVVTAPRFESVKTVFTQTARLLGVEISDGVINFQQSQLKFIAPDELVRNNPEADLLLVDEAAAIPAFILEQYLNSYNRIVFSTTVHGYEGSGRGFDIRFKQILDTKSPQWQSCVLQQPIRWELNDPLENWLFESLLLKGTSVDAALLEDFDLKQCVSEQLYQDDLLKNKTDLAQLFGLLVSAHYQTTPADLRNILDGPKISVWVSRYQGNIVAAALIADEGGFDQALAQQIWLGERRPQGHLLAQSLSAHCGFKEAPELCYQRVMRIAVHPAVQRKQVGGHLMRDVVLQARQSGMDFLGSSFAATADVLQFWRSVQCVPIRLGVSRDASSGCYSAIVLSALSNPAEDLFSKLRYRFSEHFPYDLLVQYQDLEYDLVLELLIDHDTSAIHFDQQAWLDVEAFVSGRRQVQTCRLSLCKLALLALSKKDIVEKLSTQQKAVLVKSLLQQQPVSVLVESTELTGKKALQAALREIVQVIFQQRHQLIKK